MFETTRDLAAVAAWLDRNGNASTWFSSSGEPVSGVEVANHMEAAARILSEDGWSPGWRPPGLQLDQALAAAALGGAGTSDTRSVAAVLMEAVICSATGALGAHYLLWEDVAGRTGEQVVQLLTDAAAFAREYGPEVA
jgi:hypothetical protein